MGTRSPVRPAAPTRQAPPSRPAAPSGHAVPSRPAAPTRQAPPSRPESPTRHASPSRIAAALAVVALVLTGCSVEGPETWTYRGQPLLRAGEDLAAMTETWREHVTGGSRIVNLPDGAGCYFRIAAPHAVEDVVACGPLRYGDAPVTWEEADIAGYYERDGKVALGLSGDPGTAFRAVDAGRLGELRAADGTEPAHGDTLPAPRLPELAPGEIRQLPVVGRAPDLSSFEDPDPTRDDGYRVIQAGQSVFVVRFSTVTGGAKDVEVMPPPGQRLVVVEVTDISAWTGGSDAAPAEGSSALSLSLIAGDAAPPQVIALPEVAGDAGTPPRTVSIDAGTGQRIRGDSEIRTSRWVLAVPQGEEAHLTAADGNHLASASSRPGDATSDFPQAESASGASGIVPVGPGSLDEGLDGNIGFSSQLTLVRTVDADDGPSQVELTLSTYDPTQGQDASPSAPPLRWYRGGVAIAGYQGSTVTLRDASFEVDGAAHPVSTITGNDVGDILASGDLPIPPDRDSTLTLRGTLHIELTDPVAVAAPGYDGTLPAGVPSEASIDVPIAADVPVGPRIAQDLAW